MHQREGNQNLSFTAYDMVYKSICKLYMEGSYPVLLKYSQSGWAVLYAILLRNASIVEVINFFHKESFIISCHHNFIVVSAFFLPNVFHLQREQISPYLNTCHSELKQVSSRSADPKQAERVLSTRINRAKLQINIAWHY